MLQRKELIEALAHLAAPLSPFTLEGAPDDEALFIDWVEQRGQERWRPMLDEAVEAFIDVVRRPPTPAEYMPPARDERAFACELLGLAELYSQTPHAPRIVQAIEPMLREPSRRLEAAELLGRLKHPAALPLLGALAVSGVSQQEQLGIVDAVGELGGPLARALLEELRERCAEAEVRSKIDATLERLCGK